MMNFHYINENKIISYNHFLLIGTEIEIIVQGRDLIAI